MSYWKREDISLILSKGLSKTCQVKPPNPIEYFATWLLEYNKVQKQAVSIESESETTLELLAKKKYQENVEQKRQELLQREADRKERENKDFWEEVEFSEDPYDNLEGLANYLHRNIGATGVYIGQLQPPHLKIEEDADEQAHLDLENPEVIKFKFANTNHKDLMVNQILPPTNGISHDVFSEEVTAANQEFDQNPG